MQTKNGRWIPFLAIGAVMAAIAASHRFNDEAAHEPVPMTVVPTAPSHTPLPSGSFLSEFYTITNSASFYRRLFPGLPDPTQFTIETDELNPSTSQFERSAEVHSVSFRVTAVAARTSNDIYLAGVTPGGMDTIEAWRLPVQSGEYQLTRALAQFGVGTPWTSATSVIDIFEPPFTTHVNRPARSTPQKRQIYLDDDIGQIRALAADPDGRFVVALGWGELYQVPVQPAATAELLYTKNNPTQIWMAYVDGIDVREHVTKGRVYVLQTVSAGSDLFAVLLIDSDNDGVFEDLEAHTYDSYTMDGYVDQGVWIKDFINF